MTDMLYTYRAEGLELDEAVKALVAALSAPYASGATAAPSPSGADPTLIALFYSPAACRFAVYSRGVWQQHDGQAAVRGVYEARVFSPLAELRWLNDPSGGLHHRSVVVSEDPLSGPLAAAPWSCEKCNVRGTLGQQYLLWGQGGTRACPAGWSELATARIGVLPVPLGGVQPGQRVVLKTIEYLCEREHGNVVVADERLVKLEVLKGGEA